MQYNGSISDLRTPLLDVRLQCLWAVYTSDHAGVLNGSGLWAGRAGLIDCSGKCRGSAACMKVGRFNKYE